MSKAVLTLPMMPIDGSNYGKFVTPIICETLSNILNCDYYHCINILDSFNDRSIKLDNYILSLDVNNIHYDKLWYDKENIPEFLENIETLIKNGYIFELDSSVYRCECGIVEIEKDKIHSCNPNNLKFSFNNGNLICKYCGSVCREYHEKILAFIPKNIKLTDIQVLPRYLSKDIKTYEHTVLNSYTTISRYRNTGVSLFYSGRKYNIDIDFLWATYLNTFKEQEKVIVSGNRMLYQLFLVGVLEKCLEPKNKAILIGTPYIANIKDIVTNPYFIDDEELRKLFIIFSTKWQKKEIIYDETILKYLNKLSKEKLKRLYDMVTMSRQDNIEIYQEIEDTMKHQLNMQESIKKLKLGRR